MQVLKEFTISQDELVSTNNTKAGLIMERLEKEAKTHGWVESYTWDARSLNDGGVRVIVHGRFK